MKTRASIRPEARDLDEYIERTSRRVHDEFPAWANVPSRMAAGEKDCDQPRGRVRSVDIGQDDDES